MLLCNSLSFSNLYFVVVVSAANVVLSLSLVSVKMAASDVSQKYDVIIRIFEMLKYQNIPALTVWSIVPITFLILNNHQSGKHAAKNSNSAEIAFLTFWSNVTTLPRRRRPIPQLMLLTRAMWFLLNNQSGRSFRLNRGHYIVLFRPRILVLWSFLKLVHLVLI